MLGTFALSSGYYEAYYGRARGVLERMRRELDAAFEQADLLVTPTSPTPAFGIGEKVDDPLAMYLSDIFTTPGEPGRAAGVRGPLGARRRRPAAVAPDHGPAVRRGDGLPRRPGLREREAAWRVAPDVPRSGGRIADARRRA